MSFQIEKIEKENKRKQKKKIIIHRVFIYYIVFHIIVKLTFTEHLLPILPTTLYHVNVEKQK